jgi:hypothetical protein
MPAPLIPLSYQLSHGAEGKNNFTESNVCFQTSVDDSNKKKCGEAEILPRMTSQKQRKERAEKEKDF